MKEKVQIASALPDDSDEETKDDGNDEPEFDETKIEIVVLEDDEDSEKSVVFMRKISGDFVVKEMAEIRSDQRIIDLMAAEEN